MERDTGTAQLVYEATEDEDHVMSSQYQCYVSFNASTMLVRQQQTHPVPSKYVGSGAIKNPTCTHSV